VIAALAVTTGVKMNQANQSSGMAGGTLELQTVSIRTVWALVSLMLAACVTVAGVGIAMKIEVHDAVSDVRHVRERVDQIARSVDGLGTLRVDVGVIQAELRALRSEIDRVKSEQDRMKGLAK
jgi:hypothetical protein